MSIGIKVLEQVYCSLNLGYIYNLSYNFTPQEGVKISLFFVSEDGQYSSPLSFLSASGKTQIKIGNNLFSLYAVEATESQEFDRKTMRVDFEDETRLLENYYIALTGKGCGQNVFELGSSVNPLTPAERTAQNSEEYLIKSFTTFEDIEYSFQEFINVLQNKFTVELKVDVGALSNFGGVTLTRGYTGTFKSVLNEWCSYFGISYFFEDSVLKIFDPASLVINFPDKPADAISYEKNTSIRNTYDKTVWNYFNDEGGEITIDSDSSNLVSSLQLYRLDNLFDLKFIQPIIAQGMDVKQLIAAQYGKEVWLLYNICNGTAPSICGYNPNYDLQSPLSDNQKSALTENKRLALLDNDIFETNYDFYLKYGNSIAGRLYASNQIDNIEQYSNFNWYDQGNGQIFDLNVLRQQKSLNIEIFKSLTGGKEGYVDNTNINEAYQGVILNGERFYYLDQFKRDSGGFQLSDEQKAMVAYYYNLYMNGALGNQVLAYGDKGVGTYILYIEQYTLSSDLNDIFLMFDDKKTYFDYRSENINLKGLAQIEKSNQDFNPDNTVNIQLTSDGPAINSNVSTLKAYRDSNLVIFYAKNEKCLSQSTNIEGYTRQFVPRLISNDVPVNYSVSKITNGAININRDFSYFNNYSASNILSTIARSFSIPLQKVSFSLNYLSADILTSFLSNGLVGININFNESGMIVTYNYSNEVLNVPVPDFKIENIEKSIKNSWIRQYKTRQRLKI